MAIEWTPQGCVPSHCEEVRLLEPIRAPPCLPRPRAGGTSFVQGPSQGVASTHPEGDMGTMSPKSSSPCDSRGLQGMMDEPPLEQGQSPSCPAVGEGAAGGDVGPLGGVTQVT